MEKDFLEVLDIYDLDQALKLFDRYFEIPKQITASVEKIILDIKGRGQAAVLDYSNKFDGTDFKDIHDLRVKESEINEGYQRVKEKFPALVESMDIIIDNIQSYHEKQAQFEASSWMSEPFKGKKIGQIVRPLGRICAYVPGGRYIYPSSVIMNIVPAIVAKVSEIAVCSPPLKEGSLNDVLLYLFKKLGIQEIYKVGGVQAIAMMAYGLGDTKKVDKIVGPGNVYVTAAKKYVFGVVGIDSLAGPSEIVILADGSANPRYIASDLISQAEHDPYALSILLTTDKDIAKKTISCVYALLDEIKQEYKERFNDDVAIESLKNNCKIIYCPDHKLMIDISNEIAGEHVEIMTKDPEKILEGIKNAGSIFLGDYSPVAVGDYIGGTNHVIPTSRSAMFSSPLGVYDFMKKSGLTYYDVHALKRERIPLEMLADYENLIAHKYSVEIRFKEEEKNGKY